MRCDRLGGSEPFTLWWGQGALPGPSSWDSFGRKYAMHWDGPDSFHLYALRRDSVEI